MQPGDGGASAAAHLEVVVIAESSRCVGTTRRGVRCRNPAVAGSDRCRAHPLPMPDAEAVSQLVSMLRSGNYLDVAARAAGVELAELLEHPELREEIESARAEGEVRGIARIATAAAESWQAAAWLLERQYPDRWGRPAVRAEEKPLPPAVGADGLDDLAGRRAARRSTLR